MFRPMRRINQQLDMNECMSIIEKSPRGTLAVLGDDDYPYTVVLNYVYDDDKIYFHGAMEGHKLDSIRSHDKVSFCILDDGVKVDDNWWLTFRNVICFGRIKEIDDKEKIISILRLFGEKYFPSSDITNEEIAKFKDRTLILELEIEHVTGKLVNEK